MGYYTSFLFPFLFFFYSLPSFLKSHRFDSVEFDPLSHWVKGTKYIRLIFRSKVLCEIFSFFLFLYPNPIGTTFESIENIFFCICMNQYYYIPIPSWYLPRKILKWIQNWRISVSLSMRLCILQIGIHFLKDPNFRHLVGLRDPFDDLCCVEGISIWSDRLRKARGSNGKKSRKKINLIGGGLITNGLSPNFLYCFFGKKILIFIKLYGISWPHMLKIS